MILDIYKDALEYSAKDWKTLVILGVICLFSFLFLPAFLITGFNYRVINTAVHGIINGRDGNSGVGILNLSPVKWGIITFHTDFQNVAFIGSRLCRCAG